MMGARSTLIFASFLCFAGVDIAGWRRNEPVSFQYVHRAYNHYPDLEYSLDYEEPIYGDRAGKWLCAFMGICSIPWFPGTDAKDLPITTVHGWGQLEYDYPSISARQSAISSGEFAPAQPTPIDVDVYYADNNNNKIFITSPRFIEGVPASLGVVTNKNFQGNPIISPYPSWRWHKNPRSCSPDRIVSVYRIKIDECDRLWVMDNGRMSNGIVCPPQILAFDLKTDQLIYRYEIPANQYQSNSIFVNVVPDIRDPGQCTDTFVYAIDCQAFSIVVYDVRNSRSWLVNDKTFYPFPTFGTFNIAGDSFELMDGILGAALEPLVPGRDRKLFYHAMSSNRENWVYTSYLKNQSRFMHDGSGSPEIFNTYEHHRLSQSAAIAIDRQGIAYFGIMHEITIDCWNTATDYRESNFDIVEDNRTTMQFASGVKVITNKMGTQELWILTDRFQKVAAETLDVHDVNFRISAGKIEDVLLGKRCRSSSPPHHHHHRPGSRPNKRENEFAQFSFPNQ